MAEPTYGQYLKYLTKLRDRIEDDLCSPYLCFAMDSIRNTPHADEDCETKLLRTIQRRMEGNSTALFNSSRKGFLRTPDHILLAEERGKDLRYNDWVKETRCWYLQNLINIYTRKLSKIPPTKEPLV